MTRRIEILAFPDVQLLDVAGPLQVFASTNDFYLHAGKPAPYQPVAVGADNTIVTSSALPIGTSSLPGSDQPIDTLIVPGGWGVYRACEDQALTSWIAERSKVARRTASVCSGAFLLASTGLLDGRRAVTPLAALRRVPETLPKVRLDPDPIFIQDGSIWTSAGVTAASTWRWRWWKTISDAMLRLPSRANSSSSSSAPAGSRNSALPLRFRMKAGVSTACMPG